MSGTAKAAVYDFRLYGSPHNGILLSVCWAFLPIVAEITQSNVVISKSQERSSLNFYTI